MRGLRSDVFKVSKMFILKLIFVVCFALISVLLYTHNVFAGQFSWISNTQPQVESSIKKPSLPAFCNTIERKIKGVTDPKNVCLSSHGNFNFGLYYDSGSIYKGAVSFGFDRELYPIDGMCGGYYKDCYYIADKDIMISRYYYSGSTFKTGFALFKNFSNRLTQVKDDLGRVTHYNFPIGTTTPDYVINATPTKSYNFSDNGQWIVVEAQKSGIVRINTDNLETFKFTNQYHSYGSGLDSSMELSISDDGQWVAVAGSNTSEYVYQLNEASCGYTLPTVSDINNTNYTQCPSKSIREALGDRADGLKFIMQPKLQDDGGQLSLYLGYYDYTQNGVINLLAPGYVVPSLEYLALGDSYSSGEGDTNQDATGNKYYRGWTDLEEAQGQPREKCHISTRSYPYRLAMSMGLGSPANNSSTKWQSIACSGAQTYDINEQNSKNYEGQGKGSALLLWSDGGRPRLKDFSNKEALKTRALDEFIPGRQKQIEFVKKYKPKAITITAGGNDVDFGGKLGKCVYQVDCDIASEEGRRNLGVEIKNQFTKFVNLYRDIRNTSPDTKVYVLGYPQIILDRADVQCPFSTHSLSIDERKVMVAGYWYINQVIETATRKAGVKYIDTSNSLVGYRLCESEKPYANGVIAGIGSKDERQESFHPNANGNEAIANSILSIVGSPGLINYTDYPTSSDSTISEVDIPNSDYLQTASSTSTPASEYQNITSSTVTRSQPINILIEQFSFKATSIIDVLIHSDPVSLGSYTTNENGSFNKEVEIPANTPVGYHTLIIRGETYSGEPIEFKQTIVVQSENSNDIDDDGVTDSQQTCGPFIDDSNKDNDYDGIDDACDPEISDVQPYRVRNGDTQKNENPEHMYIERNVNASSVTGISDDYDPDNDKWAIVAQSNKITNSGIPSHFWIDDNKVPHVSIRTNGRGCVQFTPRSLKIVKPNKVRNLKVEARNTNTCRSENVNADVDNNDIADNQQTLYRARNGISTNGEDPSSIYLERSSIASEAQLGLSDYLYSNQWNLLASSQNDTTKANFVKLVTVTDESSKLLPVILANQTRISNKGKVTITCIALQPQNTKIITVNNEDRKLKKVAIPEGESCE